MTTSGIWCGRGWGRIGASCAVFSLSEKLRSANFFRAILRVPKAKFMSELLRLPLHVMPKPIGPVCNLACTYCYYRDKEKLYPSGECWRMSDETLELYIRQYIAAQPPELEEIVFGWQGGEPMLIGTEFDRRVVELQEKLTPPGRRCLNALQTNGVLLDDEWVRILQEAWLSDRAVD